MKYIRTEKGIYKRREDTYIEDNSLYQIGYDFGRICLGKVIAQADTIEELCDRFIEIYDKEYIICPDLTFVCHKDSIVYGAIWTSKGLIYVAKLNDKGDLELI